MFWNVFENLCRENKGTPNKVCKELGFSNATATKWKKGALPSGDTVSKIAEYFNVTTDYLLGKTDQKNKPVEILDERTIKINELMKGLTPSEFEQALDYVRYLAGKNKEN
jgi:transcriptional regulator with XRE-family HTH domain